MRHSPDRCWKMIIEKQCDLKDYPADQMGSDAFYHSDPDRLSRCKCRSLLTSFDNLAYFIQPRDVVY